MQTFIKKKYILLIGIVLGFMFIVSLLNAWNDSAIYDEIAHIPASYSYLTQHDIRLNPEHPPLLKDISALPLLFLKPNFDTSQSFWNKDPNTAQWSAGNYFLFKAGNNPDKIIFWSRFPFIIISLIFGLFIFKWTKEIAGIGAGLLALTLYAFDPNILGHNHFVTTDLGIAAFITFAFYYFLKFIKKPDWKNVIMFGLFLGLVQLAKFSSVVAFPVFILVLILYPLVKLNKNNANRFKILGEYIGKGFLAFLISLALIWIAYYANTYKMPKEKLPEIMSYYMHPEDPRPQTIYTRKVIIAINNIDGLEPFANYLFGVARVVQRVGGGNTAYFMNEVDNKGFASYFPIVFLIKEPLPTLALILFSLALGFIALIKLLTSKSLKNIYSAVLHYLRTDIISFSMLLFIFIYSFTSITGGLNIGMRHLFPIFPFIYILISKNVIRFLKNQKNLKANTVFKIALGVLLTFLIAETISSYPYYMSYFNQAAGGPKNGHRYVTDSNADWGQDLKRLKLWIGQYNSCTEIKCDPSTGLGCPAYCYKISNLAPEQGMPIEKIKIDYFGGGYYSQHDELNYYLNDKFVLWGDNKRPIEAGWYAISTNYFESSIHDKNKPDNQSYRWLKNKQPFAQVGTSILIYNVTPEEAVAAN